MLLYLSDNQLSADVANMLTHIPSDTPVLLTQNAVYLYDRIVSLAATSAVVIVKEDARERGIAVGDKTSWSMAEWAEKGSQFTPWIKIS